LVGRLLQEKMQMFAADAIGKGLKWEGPEAMAVVCD